MDLFNTMYWAYEDGRYTDWGSVYPPLGFFILRLVNFVFAGGADGDPAYMRDNSLFVIAGVCLIYLLFLRFYYKSDIGEFFQELKNALFILRLYLVLPCFLPWRGGI